MNRLEYHSVHLPEDQAKGLSRWSDGRSTAFVHDLMSDAELPEAFDSCDLIYADLPWLRGFGDYNARAGAGERSYPRFMSRVSEIVGRSPVPVVLVTGKHARGMLPPASQEHPVRMPVAGRQAAIAYTYGMGLGGAWDTTDQLLDVLAGMFGRVGDFCAGYGWAPRAFIRAGGSFVASDFNPRCIGRIAQLAPTWH